MKTFRCISVQLPKQFGLQNAKNSPVLMNINWYVAGEDTHDELPQHWHRTRTNFNQPAKIWTILLKYSLVYNIGQGSYSTKQPATGHGE